MRELIETIGFVIVFIMVAIIVFIMALQMIRI